MLIINEIVFHSLINKPLKIYMWSTREPVPEEERAGRLPGREYNNCAAEIIYISTFSISVRRRVWNDPNVIFSLPLRVIGCDTATHTQIQYPLFNTMIKNVITECIVHHVPLAKFYFLQSLAFEKIKHICTKFYIESHRIHFLTLTIVE